MLKKVVEGLKLDYEIKSYSSIYKVLNPADHFSELRKISGELVFDGYSMAVLITADQSPEALLESIHLLYSKTVESLPQKGLSINLLVYEERVSDRPGLTLPHPELHNRPEELVPAAEVWPDYLHPILKKPLSELSRPHLSKPWGKFYLSADSLLSQP